MPGDKETRVVLADNEVIVGVAAKLFNNCKSLYSDFQFLIAAKF